MSAASGPAPDIGDAQESIEFRPANPLRAVASCAFFQSALITIKFWRFHGCRAIFAYAKGPEVVSARYIAIYAPLAGCRGNNK